MLKELETYGKSLIGKKCQSNRLTQISETGGIMLQPAQLITSFEIVNWCGEDVLILTVGDNSVFEDTCINIH